MDSRVGAAVDERVGEGSWVGVAVGPGVSVGGIAVGEGVRVGVEVASAALDGEIEGVATIGASAVAPAGASATTRLSVESWSACAPGSKAARSPKPHTARAMRIRAMIVAR